MAENLLASQVGLRSMGKGIKLVGKLFGVCDCNLHKHSQVLRLALVFLCCFFFFGPTAPSGPGPPHSRGF